MACLWHRCAHGGILSNDMRVEGVLHRLMEDGMEAVDGGIRQSGTKPRMLPDPAVLFQSPTLHSRAMILVFTKQIIVEFIMMGILLSSEILVERRT